MVAWGLHRRYGFVITVHLNKLGKSALRKLSLPRKGFAKVMKRRSLKGFENARGEVLRHKDVARLTYGLQACDRLTAHLSKVDRVPFREPAIGKLCNPCNFY